MENRGNSVDGNELFKAADTKISICIHNVSKEMAVCEIIKYIHRETSLCVTMEKINMRRAKDYVYKIFVPKHKLNLFMYDEFWPEARAYRRRFFDFKNRRPASYYSLKRSVESNKSP